MKITYWDLRRYKYETEGNHTYQTGLRLPANITSSGGWVVFHSNGELEIKDGYHWDGPSGPARDTKNAMGGSLVHDAFYQLMREGLLDDDVWRPIADEIYERICLEDGMSKFRSWYHFTGIAWFAGFAAKPTDKPQNILETAP